MLEFYEEIIEPTTLENDGYFFEYIISIDDAIR
jgi:hypothetical protein